jgi:hypothetical protein
MLSSLQSIAQNSNKQVIPVFSLLYPSSMLYWFKGGSGDISGTTLKNYANNNFEGTVFNGLSVDTSTTNPNASAIGITSGSLNFSSYNKYYQDGYLNLSSTQIANGLTFSFWIKTNISLAQNTYALTIFDCCDFGTSSKGGFLIQIGTSIGINKWCGGSNQNTASWTLSSGDFQTWTHFCINVPASGNMVCYKNGSLMSNGTFAGSYSYPAGTNTPFPITLGQSPYLYQYNIFDYGMNSHLSDFRLYNKILTASEISLLYSGYG